MSQMGIENPSHNCGLQFGKQNNLTRVYASPEWSSKAKWTRSRIPAHYKLTTYEIEAAKFCGLEER